MSQNNITQKKVAQAAARLAKRIEQNPLRFGRLQLVSDDGKRPCCAMGHFLVDELGFKPSEIDGAGTGQGKILPIVDPPLRADVNDVIKNIVRVNDADPSDKSKERFRKERKAALSFEFKKLSRILAGKSEPKVPEVLLNSRYFNQYAHSGTY